MSSLAHRAPTVKGMVIGTPSKRNPYTPPYWAVNHLQNLPQHGRLNLANLPTPLHLIHPPRVRQRSDKDSVLQRLWDLNISLFIKRDDMSGGVELGGNKVRKLEFLLADALEREFDSVVTIGGEQSNHCRATATACRMLGLDPHLILRTKRADQIYDSSNGDDLGYTGNILFDRLVGSKIYTCTPGEYGRIGSDDLVARLCQYIEKKEQKKVYPIPVGGSNALGSWGYIEGVREVMEQLGDQKIDHIVFASGSGGTAAGITLGILLAHGAVSSCNTLNSIDDVDSIQIPEIHGVGVCDNPDYFYNTISKLADEMGLNLSSTDKGTNDTKIESFIRRHLTVHQGKGLGYASSTSEELSFITQFAIETGIVLDPVYSGKALFHFITSVLEEEPERYRNSNIMFWHTGGALGTYDKGIELHGVLQEMSQVKRIDVYNKGHDAGKVSI